MSRILRGLGLVVVVVIVIAFAVRWTAFSADEENLRAAVFNKSKEVCLSGGNSVRSGVDRLDRAERYRLQTILDEMTGGVLYPRLSQRLTEDMRSQWNGRPQIWNAACRVR